MKRFILVMLYFLCSVSASAYEYEISACCIFQNEASFLKEWIDYHRLIGVDHFYVYDNISTDHPREILDAYVKEGVVEYIYWNRTYTTDKEWWVVQCDAYKDALRRAKNRSKWLAIIDTDEFIVPIQDRDLKLFLLDFEDFGGVCIHWVFYGSSGIQKISQDTWMILQLLKRADMSYPLNRIVKSIVRPERVDLKNSFLPHTCAYIEGYYHVNAKKQKLKKNVVRDCCNERIRLHHYWARDLDFLHNHKYPRYARWIGKERALEKIKIEEKMNDCFDPIIVNVVERLRSKN